MPQPVADLRLDPCTTPATGCSCEEEGAEVECGTVLHQSDDYLSCSVGKRRCAGGVWGACVGNRVEYSEAAEAPRRLTQLLTPTGCDDNPCDPYCKLFDEDPSLIDAPSNVAVTDDGLTLVESVGGTDGEEGACSGVAVVPAEQTFIITSLSELVGESASTCVEEFIDAPGAGGATPGPGGGTGASAGTGSIPTEEPTPTGASGLLGEYFNRNGAGGISEGWTPDFSRVDPNVDFDWGFGSPDSTILSDGFCSRWTGYIVAPESGTYRFYSIGNDNSRLWVGDENTAIIDATNAAHGEYSADVYLNAGVPVYFRAETWENGGSATARVRWSGPGISGEPVISGEYFRRSPDGDSGSGADNGSDGGGCEPVPVEEACSNDGPLGLLAEYFNRNGAGGISDSWTPDFTRNDPNVDFNWGTGSPDGSVDADGFSSRWTGYVVAPESGTYRFYSLGNDNSRLWVGDESNAVVDATNYAHGEYTADVVMTAGVPAYFRAESWDNGYNASMRVRWSGPGISGEPVIAESYFRRSSDNEGGCASEPPGSDDSCTDLLLHSLDMSASTGGSTYDFFASDDVWNIWSNGTLSTTHSFAAGEHEMVVTAKGQRALDGDPHMVVYVDGEEIYDNDVGALGWEDHTFRYTSTSAGSKTVVVEFDNDAYDGSSGEDRNLLVHQLAVTCPEPVLACSGEESASGGAGGASAGGNGGASGSGGGSSSGGGSGGAGGSGGESTANCATGSVEDPVQIGVQKFSLVGVPEGCTAGELEAAWTVDKPGIATIDHNGVFQIAAAVGGDIQVQAHAGSQVAAATVHVVVDVKESNVSQAVAELFEGDGAGSTDPMTVRYPYVDTVFPLGLMPPTVQWNRGGDSATAVRVGLRWPAAGEPQFQWQVVTSETSPARYTIPMDAWRILEQVAKGDEAAITVQRLVGGSLREEVVRPFRFADATLRGQIIYTEYGRGDYTALEMFARPGTTDIAIDAFRGQDSGSGGRKCPVCHSVSAHGNKLLTSDDYWSAVPGVSNINSNGTLTNLSDMPDSSKYREGAADFRGFAWAAVSPSGELALSSSNFWGNTENALVGVSESTGSLNSYTPVGGMLSSGRGRGLRASYYYDDSLSGEAWLRTDPIVDFDWGSGAPAGHLASNGFSVRWEGQVQSYYSEEHTLYLTSPDGVRLTVGGQVLFDELDESSSSARSHQATVFLKRGVLTPIVIEHREVTGDASLRFEWEAASVPRATVPQTQLYWDDSAHGVVATYYDDDDWTDEKGTRVEPQVAADWGGGQPLPSMDDDSFSSTWRASVEAPVTGNYRFCLDVRNRAVLNVDGVERLNLSSSGDQCSSALFLSAGELYPVRVDHSHQSGDAELQLSWTAEDGSGSSLIEREVIPTANWFLPSDYNGGASGLTATYYDTTDFNVGMGTGPSAPHAVRRVEAEVDHDWGDERNRAEYSQLRSNSGISAHYTGLLRGPCTGFTDLRLDTSNEATLWLDGVRVASVDDGTGETTKYLVQDQYYEVKIDWVARDGAADLQFEWNPCRGSSYEVVGSDYLEPEGDLGAAGFVRGSGDNGNGVGYWVWDLPEDTGVVSDDVTSESPAGWGLEGTTMMVPSFSPDGTRLVFIDGDQDAGGGWRKGLSVFDFDRSAKAFSNRRNIVSTWPFGHVLKWPTFESDSRSVIYSASPGVSTCCVNERYLDYGNMSPTDQGQTPGQLWSVDSSALEPTPVFLQRATQGELPVDANKAWQPTMLPVAAGGYRWVVFTSTRPYGNTLNEGYQQDYSDLEDYTRNLNEAELQPQLWVAAIDDSTSAEEDRSHPAFWLPNQRYSTDPSRGKVNERGFWTLDACRSPGTGPESECVVNADCCQPSDGVSKAVCRVDVPVTVPPTRHCQVESIGKTCAVTGDSCAGGDDCCSGLVCAGSVCEAPPEIQAFSAANLERVYEGSCDHHSHPAWRFLDWQATTPETGAMIEYYIETAADANAFHTLPRHPDAVELPGVIYLGRAIGPQPMDTWVGMDLGKAFREAGVAQQDWVKVTMRFVPNQEFTQAPVLHDFRVQYSCPPNQ